MADDAFSSMLLRRLADPETVAMIRRALAQGVVLDTWMNGEEEERFSEKAETALIAAAERWVAEALRTGAIFTKYQMPAEYIRSVFHELLFSMALYVAQKKKGCREVTPREVEEAIDSLSRFIAVEPDGLTAVGWLFFTISTHEDLNAIAYYVRMKRDEFLLGTLHRPWSNLLLNTSLLAYQHLDLIANVYAGDGDMLVLTQRGGEVLSRLRAILSDAGELKWRTDNQRWVIFSEVDYDKLLADVLPDLNQRTREYLERLGLKPGMRVLEVGPGTGRATVDLGLCDMVGPSGSVVALDPTAAFLQKLAAKCRDRGIGNVEIVQGVAEDLPFPDNSFDAAVAVASLQFTDASRAVAEMVRVTKPGGFVSAMLPPAGYDVRDIPMVALWLRPLTTMAEQFGVPFSEHNGLSPGLLKDVFQKNLEDVVLGSVPCSVSAVNYNSYLAFALKGAALFQNIFCRLPYQERWGIMSRLEEDGARIAAEISEKEKSCVYFGEEAYGRVPVKQG